MERGYNARTLTASSSMAGKDHRRRPRTYAGGTVRQESKQINLRIVRPARCEEGMRASRRPHDAALRRANPIGNGALPPTVPDEGDAATPRLPVRYARVGGTLCARRSFIDLWLGAVAHTMLDEIPPNELANDLRRREVLQRAEILKRFLLVRIDKNGQTCCFLFHQIGSAEARNGNKLNIRLQLRTLSRIVRTGLTSRISAAWSAASPTVGAIGAVRQFGFHAIPQSFRRLASEAGICITLASQTVVSRQSVRLDAK